MKYSPLLSKLWKRIFHPLLLSEWLSLPTSGSCSITNGSWMSFPLLSSSHLALCWNIALNNFFSHNEPMFINRISELFHARKYLYVAFKHCWLFEFEIQNHFPSEYRYWMWRMKTFPSQLLASANESDCHFFVDNLLYFFWRILDFFSYLKFHQDVISHE